MKPIVVPVDFSDVASNAAEYAIKLAARLKTEIILLHIYHVPEQVAQVPFITATEMELHDEALKLLNSFSEMLARHADISIQPEVRPGGVTDNIIEVCKESKAGLVVMGINGRGALGKYFIGSNAVNTARRSPVPVMIIPAEAKYREIGRIVLASDFTSERVTDNLVLIDEIMNTFDTCIDFVKVAKQGESADIFKEVVNKMEKDPYFRSCSHATHFIYSSDTITALAEFAQSRNADVIAVVPHHHSFFERIFRQSTTKRVAFHTHIPLLAIPQTNKEKEDKTLDSLTRSLEKGLDDNLTEAIG